MTQILSLTVLVENIEDAWSSLMCHENQEIVPFHLLWLAIIIIIFFFNPRSLFGSFLFLISFAWTLLNGYFQIFIFNNNVQWQVMNCLRLRDTSELSCLQHIQTTHTLRKDDYDDKYWHRKNLIFQGSRTIFNTPVLTRYWCVRIRMIYYMAESVFAMWLVNLRSVTCYTDQNF